MTDPAHTVSIGERYLKDRPATHNRTKPENRGKRSLVEVTCFERERGYNPIVQLRVVSGPLIFSTRMATSVLLKNFTLVEPSSTKK